MVDLHTGITKISSYDPPNVLIESHLRIQGLAPLEFKNLVNHLQGWLGSTPRANAQAGDEGPLFRILLMSRLAALREKKKAINTESDGPLPMPVPAMEERTPTTHSAGIPGQC